MKTAGDYQFLRELDEQISKLRNEKDALLLNIEAFEKSSTAKLDAKSEKLLTYYTSEIENARAKHQKAVAYFRKEIEEADNKLEKTEKYYGNMMVNIGKNVEEPRTITKDKMKLSDIQGKLEGLELRKSVAEQVYKPGYVFKYQDKIPPPKPWDPFDPSRAHTESVRRNIALEEERLKLRAAFVPEPEY
jgi:DNA repair exonuclease SbcCD ATPase subunit